ncbi:MAG TPA: hypothetical protein VN982_01715 [Candidatus Dormibacteraeota bacterium]|nr:hypothetical protein [Candidatus Dormibacteraeota bacterium]
MRLKKEYGPSHGREMIRALTEAAQQIKREELVKTLPLNYTLRYLYCNGILPTVRNYLALEYMSDVSGLEDVGPEDRTEIERLIEDGFLVDTKSERVN